MNTLAGARSAATALAFLGAASTGPSRAAEHAPHDVAGVWWAETSTPQLRLSDGSPPPFTPEGRARYDRIVAGLGSGALVDEAVHLCIPEGMPRAMTSAYPFQVIVTPGQVTFAHEANRAYRMVAFTATHQDPKVWDPSYMGDGVAHWEGDVLVIDSTNFKADRMYLDASGEPASDKLHVVEHIRTMNDAKVLEDLVTIEDPVIFSKPWTARLTFHRRDDISIRPDWVCGERHRDVAAHMAGAAR